MTDHELNTTIYNALAMYGNWLTFDQLDQILAKADKTLRPEPRRAMLRGEIARMLHSGQIIRDKYTTKYHISDDVNLF